MVGVFGQQLPTVDEISSSDTFLIFSVQNGDFRRVPQSVFIEFMQANLDTWLPEFVTQYAAPSATGFSVTLTDGDENDSNIHLILTPTGGFAAGTLVLPTSTGLRDKQEILINCTQSVTTLTITGSGATVTGAPTTLAANAFFRLKYDDALNVWYRVG